MSAPAVAFFIAFVAALVATTFTPCCSVVAAKALSSL